MKVLKIVAEGLVTSFRYPYFMFGVQPTFTMPPPATLYGHVASTLGEWFDPRGVLFAVHFSFQKRLMEIEHTHVLTSAKGKLKGSNYSKVLEGKTNLFQREILFKPKLVLYLNRPEWVEYFKCPRYSVTLGRSQDLFTYSEVTIVELQRATNCYIEHTLLPYEFTRYIGQGVAILMPQWLEYKQQRYPNFRQYVILNRRVQYNDFICLSDDDLSFWVDPLSKTVNGDQLGLVFHSWVEDNDEIALA